MTEMCELGCIDSIFGFELPRGLVCFYMEEIKRSVYLDCFKSLM
jgi:hypothetical protein